MLQNILFVKDCLSENILGSFNDKFDPSKLPLNDTTRSSSTYQLKVNNFQLKNMPQINSEQMYIRLEQPPKNIKTNFQMMKRSDLKTNIKNYFLKQFNDKKD